MNLQDLWPQAVTLIGTVIWAVRVEGKVQTLEALNEVQTIDIKARLVRIENKLDRANGVTL